MKEIRNTMHEDVLWDGTLDPDDLIPESSGNAVDLLYDLLYA